MNTFADGYHLVVKEDCPTCRLIEPVCERLADLLNIIIYTQDDISFPQNLAQDDRSLESSFHLKIDTVPTLIRMVDGAEVARTVGWDVESWRNLTQIDSLGFGLPASKPGCGALNVMPGIVEELEVKYGDTGITARQIEVDLLQDPVEHAYERGWSDGLPVVPPTPARVLRMLRGTSRRPDEIVAIVPPNQAPCTVEKVAINAVMAGCKPEYLPVVLTTVAAACQDVFALHGLLATTFFSSPIVIVNGPITEKIGMNSGINALGQGNRANSTIGRALQLVVRNVGGGLPGGVDRALMGYPGKIGFCFAEREADSPFESLAVSRGFSADKSVVTLFGGGGVHGMMDQKSRTPDSLARSLAASLKTVNHVKLPLRDALLVLSPAHGRTFKEAGWSRDRVIQEINSILTVPGTELVEGAGGIAEGIPAKLAGATWPKFRPDGLLIVHVGGNAGMFSAIIGGWAASGAIGTVPVSAEIEPWL